MLSFYKKIRASKHFFELPFLSNYFIQATTEHPMPTVQDVLLFKFNVGIYVVFGKNLVLLVLYLALGNELLVSVAARDQYRRGRGPW